ncbi:CHAD domain-containing protein [Sulfurospirillum oryzae]|uniref:CHAD domain-containing protein n=1 Tax=Sulfurospirillum oryzae TaxID=2976535 RepID=UPI0021E8E9C2|nr:CHAD domain-containing protein [Sulfurospirillum oryzae]
MSSKTLKLNCHSVKSLLKNTLSKTTQNMMTYLSDFLQTKEPESLHQYRVNIRMARSVCLELSDFMEEKRKNKLDKILKTLQQETNDMRDIDVFIECIGAYKNSVDPQCLSEFEGIEAKLKAEKEEAYKAFEAKYTEAFQTHIMTQLQSLQNDDLLCLPKSEEKLFKYIKEIFFHRLKKIAKASKKLTLSAPNERFHKLRLHYKKLRYNADAVKLNQFSKSFKPLQTAFGNVQDKNSQIERIKHYNVAHSVCLEQIIALLEQELILDKQACIEKSSKENIVRMKNSLEKIFTCKDS